MIKLYKRDTETFRYHETWESQGRIIEHWGVVGSRGETRPRAIVKSWTKKQAIDNVLRRSRETGFAPFPDAERATLMIEYEIAGFGGGEDLKKRHDLEARMNETLGWTGLGLCDGGSIGSGTMEVCCFVVDFEIAKRVIEEDLKNTSFSDYVRIYDENCA